MKKVLMNVVVFGTVCSVLSWGSFWQAVGEFMQEVGGHMYG